MNKQGSYGEAIRRARRHKRISQDRMTPLISRAYISDVERDRKIPTVRMIEKVAQRLEISPLALYLLAFADSPSDIENLCLEAAESALSVLRDAYAIDESD